MPCSCSCASCARESGGRRLSRRKSRAARPGVGRARRAARESPFRRTSARARTGAADAARSRARGRAARRPARRACRPARRRRSAPCRRTNAPCASREPLDAPVRNRDALSQAGRAQLLARGEAVDDDGARQRRSSPRTAADGVEQPRLRSRRRDRAGCSTRAGARRSGSWTRDSALRLARETARAQAAVSRLTAGPLVPMQRELFLVLHHLAVELVDQRVDRRVHVGLDRLDSGCPCRACADSPRPCVAACPPTAPRSRRSRGRSGA